MANFDQERLYRLLPAIYRLQDAQQGEPLKALLGAIAEEVAVLEEDLAQLYDDQFIETCAPWVISYLGDLVGARLIHPLANLTPKLRSNRAMVANTIAYRRRKGTIAILEQLARDVTGWDASVVEYFQRLATTQYLNHLRPSHASWLPAQVNRELLNTAFDPVPRTVDVRRIPKGRGRYNIPNIGIFLWRLGSYSLKNSTAFQVDQYRYLFNPLGNNTSLFSRSQPETEITHLAERINIPMPIRRWELDTSFKQGKIDPSLELFYGFDKSFFLIVNNRPVPLDQLIVCDLSDGSGNSWLHPPTTKIAIDPQLGRIAFPSGQKPPRSVIVYYHYGFSASLGGGEYARSATINYSITPIVKITAANQSLQAAFNQVTNGGAVEISISDRIIQTPQIRVNNGKKLEFRAADGVCPLLVLSEDLTLAGDIEGEITLNGLVLSGGSLRIQASNNRLKRLRLRHCTLVPGLTLATDGSPQSPKIPSLIVESPDTQIEIEDSILGAIRITEGNSVTIRNSIVDAIAKESFALVGLDNNSFAGILTVINSTIIGQIKTVLLTSASNSIFLGTVTAQRRQSGCLRFSFLPPDSQVPQAYACQPQNSEDCDRLFPQFTSLQYGDPGYGQLSLASASEIRKGAEDEAEMGVFHDLYQPQREINLTVRLEEYLRFGLEAGIIYVT